MNETRSILLTLTLLVLPLFAQSGSEWHSRWADAEAQARDTARPVLVFFTDSVQCPWCAKLKKDVLDSTAFRDWASKSVVLLELDFPTGQPQDPAIKEHNEALKKKFAVRSYPMVVFVSADQKELGRISGYQSRDKWLAQAKKIVSK